MKKLITLLVFTFVFAFSARSASACGMPNTYFFFYEGEVYSTTATVDKPVSVKLFDPAGSNRLPRPTINATFTVYRDENRNQRASLEVPKSTRSRNLRGSTGAVYRCLDSPSTVSWDGEVVSETMTQKLYAAIRESEEAAKLPRSVGVKVKIVLYPEAAKNFSQYGVKLEGDVLVFADGTTVNLFSNGENARVELRANDSGNIVARVYEKGGDVLEYRISRGRFIDEPTKLP